MKRLWIALTVLMLCFGVHASDTRRDGNWWLNLSEIAKLSYATGFFDGMQLGHDFSWWNMLDQDGKSKKGLDECVSEVDKSSTLYDEKYFSHVTNEQLVAGLDSFYSDYRNRRIRVSGAVWLVVNGIAGTPQEKLNRMVERWRQSAAD